MYFPRLFTLITILSLNISLSAQVGINSSGNSPDNSAMLDIISTDKGMLIPRMGSSDRTMIVSPADGLMVYDTTTTSFWYYDNNKWNEIGQAFDQLKPSDLIGDAVAPDFSCFQQTGTTSTSASPNSIAVNGDYVYVGHITDVFRVYSISDPNNPVQVGTANILNGISNIVIQGIYAYVINNSTFKIIDISDPTSPTEVATLGLGLATESLAVKGNYAYVASSFQNNIQIIDISNPLSPSIANTFAGGQPRDIKISGDYIYAVSVSGNSLRILDISNPTSPSLDGTLSLPDKPFRVSVSDNYAYVLNVFNDSLDIIDVSQSSNPIKVGALYNGPDPTGLASQGPYTFVTDYDYEQFYIVDGTDPTNPMVIGSLPTNVDPLEIATDGDYACVIDDASNELRVFQLICPSIATFSFNPFSNTFEPLEDFPVDNMGNHKATQNIELNGKWLSGDAGDEGIAVDNNGDVGIGTLTPNSSLQVNGSIATPYVDTGSSTGTFTVDDTHHTIRVFNDISTLALPDASTMPGRIYTLIGSNGMSAKTITVAGGGIVYDDVTNTTVNSLNGNTRLRIQSDGGIWIVIGN